MPEIKAIAKHPAGRAQAGLDAADFRVRLQLLRGLYNHIRVVLFGNLGTMALAVVLLWDQPNRAWLLAWALILGLVALGRWGLARIFRRASVTPETIGRWEWAHAIATGAQGLAWGATSKLILLPDPASFMFLAVMAIAALTLVALMSYSANLLTFAAFVVPSVVPYAIGLVGAETAVGYWALPLCAAWIGAALLVARSFNRRYRRDIEQQIEREELIGKLEAARDEARRANEAKTRFLGHMSHELRTPLTAILGFSEMIMARVVEPGGPKFDGYIKGIHDSGRHLLRLVSDILDLTRIEAGRFALEEETVHLAGLLAEAAALFRDEAAKDGIMITIEHADPGLKLRADPTRLRQVAYNLLSNALKYSPADDVVRITTHRRADGVVEIAFADNGQGMTKDEIARAGIPFEQFDRRGERHTPPPHKRGHYASPGTGIGFPLVVKLMEAHGGHAVIDAESGKGCTVTAVFPKERVL